MLLVDDDVDACELMKDLFARRGVRAHCVFNGAEAIELLDQLGHTHDSLPGVLVTRSHHAGHRRHEPRRVRAGGSRLVGIPIVIVTASPNLAPAGHLVLKKPVDVDALLAFVNHHLMRAVPDRGRNAEA